MQPVESGRDEREDVQGPQLRSRQQRVHQQERRHHAERDLGEEHHPAAVDGVGERAAVQPEDDERDQLDEAEDPHEHERPGQLLHLVRDRDVGDHRAQPGDGPAGEEQSVLTGRAQRRRVDAQAAAVSVPETGYALTASELSDDVKAGADRIAATQTGACQ